MRAKICRDVDLEMLDRAIAQFEKENFPYCDKSRYNYIIMSKNTLDAIAYESIGHMVKHNDDNTAEYKGNKIAIDQSIPYGEVEIR